jgi:hypothetical protein
MSANPQEPQSYPSRLFDAVKLWNEARRAAKHEDSIFIWIPKNAGTSVYTMLRPHGLVKLTTTRTIRFSFHNSGRVTFGHISIASLMDLGIVSRSFVEGAFKFAFARDPFARAVSLYRYLSGNILLNWHEQPTFREFLRLIADGYYDGIGAYNSLGLSQCNPQIEWIRATGADKIYKVEDLGEFITDISDRWGLAPGQLPHTNRSDRAVSAELTRDEKSLIKQIYAEDFDRFGYSNR